MDELIDKHCKACEGGVAPLTHDEVARYLKKLQGWEVDSASKMLTKSYAFKNYYHTMAFVNALAWMAHGENHHPDLEVSYNRCKVHYTTHAIDGLSENDFICAAKVDQILQKSSTSP